jgi:L-seryl-tRNA(Ser) seleniumtransferase
VAQRPRNGQTDGDIRRSLPSIDRLLRSDAVEPLLAAYPRQLVVEALREAVAASRAGATSTGPTGEEVVASATAALEASFRPSPRPVINATGVILHTNLGRAPLSPAALEAMAACAADYSALEYDVDAGARGSRHDHVLPLLQRLTGAEAALVVNNNASAVLLALAALAAGREVVISRGQLVEIGGGFRIPDVLRQSGAHLVEVGTTNRTYVADYGAAITDATALLLRVHASNFRVLGFVHSPSLAELVRMAHDSGLLLVDDLGSGSLLPTERFGLSHEPMVQESVADGADLVCFSGDKLLGGPQAGILVGRQATIAQLRRHPLTRALRPDKATLAGLHGTLLHYLRNEADRAIPVWRMIASPADEIQARARRLAESLATSEVAVTRTEATVGGGSLPGETLPSWALAIRSNSVSSDALGARLRARTRPIIGRIQEDRLLLDLRTVPPELDDEVLAAVAATIADLAGAQAGRR